LKTQYPNRIIITGASGYIASALLRRLPKESLVILISRDLSNFQTPNLSSIGFVECDLASENPWKNILKGGETIYHLASQTNIVLSNQDPKKDWLINVKPIHEIALVSKELPKPVNVVFTGSVTQFGLTGKLPVDESCEDHPITMYDFHKLEGENLLKYYTSLGFIQSTTLRLANIYGPGSRSKNLNRGILSQIICNALNGQSIKAYGGGSYIRDFVFIDDLISALLLSREFIDALNGKHYIISSGKGVELREIFVLVQSILREEYGIVVEIESVSEPQNLDSINRRNFIGNSSTFSSITQWQASTSLRNGIEQTIQYFYK